eukprot:52044-Eustigmatos_ZCMA.PRE.1
MVLPNQGGVIGDYIVHLPGTLGRLAPLPRPLALSTRSNAAWCSAEIGEDGSRGIQRCHVGARPHRIQSVRS